MLFICTVGLKCIFYVKKALGVCLISFWGSYFIDVHLTRIPGFVHASKNRVSFDSIIFCDFLFLCIIIGKRDILIKSDNICLDMSVSLKIIIGCTSTWCHLSPSSCIWKARWDSNWWTMIWIWNLFCRSKRLLL